MNNNYMRAAELKIAKLDPVKDLWEIMYLRFNAMMQKNILEQVLNEQKDFELLEKEENELRKM